MGCDIHCYVEYRNRGDENRSWRDFGGRINPGRNYLMFSIMAGVRCWNENENVLFRPKGLPKDIAYSAQDDNFLYITDNEKCSCGGSRSVSMERAERWVKNGSSVFKHDQNGKPTWVSGPDWHSHSWLSLEEYRQVLAKFKELEQIDWVEREQERLEFIEKCKDENIDIKDHSWLLKPCEHYDEPEYQAIEAAMSRLEEMGYETRLVFWFDN